VNCSIKSNLSQTLSHHNSKSVAIVITHFCYSTYTYTDRSNSIDECKYSFYRHWRLTALKLPLLLANRNLVDHITAESTEHAALCHGCTALQTYKAFMRSCGKRALRPTAV